MKKLLLKSYLVFTYCNFSTSGFKSGVKAFAKDFDDENEAIEYAKELKNMNQCNWVDVTSLKSGESIFIY